MPESVDSIVISEIDKFALQYARTNISFAQEVADRYIHNLIESSIEKRYWIWYAKQYEELKQIYTR